MPPLTKTTIIANHPSTRLYPEAIEEYLSEEVEAGRMSGPFTLSEVEAALRGPVFVSPLIVAVQPQLPGEPDKLRVCRHLSKDAGSTPSVNSYVDKADFPTRFDTASRVADIVSKFPFTSARRHWDARCKPLPDGPNVRWTWRMLQPPDGCSLIGAIPPDGPSECCHQGSYLHEPLVRHLAHDSDTHTLIQVAHIPEGALACTFDIKKFHRTCPVAPAHKCWLVVQGSDGRFYLDHVHPFGAGVASSNAGMIANAAVDIWVATGISPVLKYEDDLKAFATPVIDGPFHVDGFDYAYNKLEALRRIQDLNIPWHDKKGDAAFLPVTTFIGYVWDLPQRRVSLSDEKRKKFRHRVRTFIESFKGHRCRMIDVQKIHGSLCHVAFVYPEGRSHLPSLSTFTAHFRGKKYAPRFPPHSVLTDLRWWRSLLAKPGRYRQLSPRGQLEDLGIFVDASTSWGVGVVIGDRWAAFQLVDGWKEKGIDICWLEVLALEFLFYILIAEGVRNRHVLVRSDNQGAIGAIGKGRSANHAINMAVRRIHAAIIPAFITPKLIYVDTHSNIADPVSRGTLGHKKHRIQHAGALVPDELRSKFIIS